MLERARAFGLPKLRWEVRLDSPAGLPQELTARGAALEVTIDVLACDLRAGAPALPPASADVKIRWATDFETSRDGSAVGVTGFGGTLPPDDRIEANAARDAATVPVGEGGMLVAYVNGVPAGSGGVTIVDGVARLWGGVVVPSARGQGVYRAVLDARLSYAVAHGATMALVEGEDRHVRADPATGRVRRLRAGAESTTSPCRVTPSPSCSTSLPRQSRLRHFLLLSARPDDWVSLVPV